MNRARLVSASILVLTALCGCDTGSRHAPNASVLAGSGQTPKPGSVNVLSPPPGAASTPGAASGGATSGTGTGTSGGSSGAPAGGSPPAGGAAAAPAPPAAPSGAQLWGTVPPDPETGFDGALYFIGERLLPGSTIAVAVNGVPTKVLPAVFHSSELLGVYVYLTVPAAYTFTAVGPDGSLSSSLTLVVPDGGPAAVLGMERPEVSFVFPPALDAGFAGTVWLIGDGFVPGCTLTATVQGIPVQVAPLVFVNDRTVGWITATPLPGDVTIQVTNPTFLASPPLTLTVGPAPPPATVSGPTPLANGPSGVTSPFLGAVHLVGSGIVPGAVAELRPRGGGATVSATPLVWLSPSEAHWMLFYPRPGPYEMRVVNPGGAASAWRDFEVR